MSNQLSKYFIGVGIKRLRPVEINPEKSNQHEFNGIAAFKSFLGSDNKELKARFISLSDDEEKVKEALGKVTWYDARRNHATRSEYRLYYQKNEITTSANAGDLVVIALVDQANIVVITAPQNSTSEKQLLYLFSQEEADDHFVFRDLTTDKKDIGFAGKYILTSLGIDIIEETPNYLEDIIQNFGKSFPSTKSFSEFARSTVKDVSPTEEPDTTLMMWLEREELLFKTLEKEIIKEILAKGFGEDGSDVDEFIKFSLSVQNRRKSRAGYSFEYNLAALFNANGIKYSHGAVTERNNKPDFIFPGIAQYHDQTVDIKLLTMLGVKTTAKDRWRQILPEAERIPNKHLITLEPAISRNQTEEMQAHNLQLVIPKNIHDTYSTEQQKFLINVKDFINLVRDKQNKS